MQSATEDLSPVLPDYFPSLTRECQKAGLVFFHCFSEQSKHKGTEDAQAGVRGLVLCQEPLQAYAQCMERSLKQPQKPFVPMH
ncbi:uncharacterized protein ACA1_125530 [Acanthamoeba castellanii str. Neff]|uniref:COX assembly mitochondrial protein n=1 Tax=Acanthamoeba castellanii (strain ATCC 30010 / Neff) TaxID=1257118 RepID=L8GNU0_ACACF|nr:uncharacterized protein ACA1_125530 [Acanthamoeba castellanii str. Neff]ELR14679.1 hypothetical protein ACA1_125530 [Acanthamoeba castellanii str. Neff]